jgi:hypothetical protein
MRFISISDLPAQKAATITLSNDRLLKPTNVSTFEFINDFNFSGAPAS